MKRMIHNTQTGFTAVEGLLIILILVIIGAVGYFVYQSHKKVTTVSSPAATQTDTGKSTSPEPAAKPDPYAGWKSYTLASEKLSFKYPSSWTLQDYSNDPSNQAGTDTLVLKGTDELGGETFQMSIADGDGVRGLGLPLGGLHIAGTTPVTFAGQSGWLVSYNGESNGQVLDTELSTSKTAVNFFNARHAAGSDAGIAIGIAFGDSSAQNWADVQSSTDFKDASLVVDSMTY